MHKISAKPCSFHSHSRTISEQAGSQQVYAMAAYQYCFLANTTMFIIGSIVPVSWWNFVTKSQEF